MNRLADAKGQKVEHNALLPKVLPDQFVVRHCRLSEAKNSIELNRTFIVFLFDILLIRLLIEGPKSLPCSDEDLLRDPSNPALQPSQEFQGHRLLRLVVLGQLSVRFLSCSPSNVVRQ